MGLTARVMAAGALAVIALTGLPARAASDWAVCGAETARQETRQSVPDRLLHAISLVESGRWDGDKREVLAWPWTVTAEGEGRYLPSKDAAVAEVRKLQARGVRNIDVGCMQVNLLAHPDAFASLDEAFDPAANVAYAAQFLVSLFGSSGDWATAGAWYHSQTPELAADYKAKLVATWDKLRHHDDTRIQFAAAEALPENRPPLGIMLIPHDATPNRSIDSIRAAALTRTEAERAESKRIADAYRQAKLAEYRQRKEQLAAAGKISRG
jgi:hypothetical protein